ncbi:hypothetical protein [Herbaspirillum sp. C7C8]|uniref:hypothetical protein n=1 Tax=Herbaspirillum sp. C7C8 TaxID=2736665 RepID=UPI001F529A47|nr:hypothetical protein [Herbaspirillum sp. C7C8]MCI1003280.1 hypothetical protein [Herbaspirillum sp. C7C8]
MPKTEAELNSIIADARLGAAEELGWPCSVLGAVAIYLHSGSWLLTAAGAIGVYGLATFKYRRDASRAEDLFHREAGLGKHYKPEE